MTARSQIGQRKHRLIRRRPVLVVAVATITMVVLGLIDSISGPSLAFADTIVGGCTIVSNPTPTHFTNCPGFDFSSSDLSGLDLSYANLSGSIFAKAPFTLAAANLRNADLHDANVSGSVFTSSFLGTPTIYVVATADLTGATLTGLNANGAQMQQMNFSNVDLTNASFSHTDFSDLNVGSTFGGATLVGTNFSDANLGSADLSNTSWSGSNLSGTTFFGATLTNTDFSGADLTNADFTGTVLMPLIQPSTPTSPAGAVVTWSSPPALLGATPGPCTPPSGSTFPPGDTDVTCTVVDSGGHQAGGFARVYVAPFQGVEITTTTLPPATVGVPYSTSLSASGGNLPYTWRNVRLSGKPPSGLKLDKSTGIVSGTPTRRAATSTFTVEVLDMKIPRSRYRAAVQHTATKTFTITVSS